MIGLAYTAVYPVMESHTHKDTKSKQSCKHTYRHINTKNQVENSYTIFSSLKCGFKCGLWHVPIFICACVRVEAAQKQIGLVRSLFTVLKAAFLWPLHMSLQPVLLQ